MSALGMIDELRRKRLTPATVENGSVVVVATDEAFLVVVNRCPHQQAEILHEGSVEDGGLTCPLHGRTFDLKDGRCRNGAGRLTFVPSIIVDGVVWAGPIPIPDFPAF